MPITDFELAYYDQVGATYDLNLEYKRLKRKIKPAVAMLEDALHALRHERYHVTDEYVERVIDSLKRATE
jgi:hypothetical protein